MALTPAMMSLLEARAFRFARAWEIARRDGVTFRVTNAGSDLVFDGFTWKAKGGLSATASQKQDSLRAADQDLESFVSSDFVKHEDLLAGKYRAAVITEHTVDWRFPWAGKFQTRVYRVGDMEFHGEAWRAQVAGLFDTLAHTVGRSVTRDCSAVLGDTRCKVVLDTFKISGASVISVTDLRRFRGSHAGFNAITLFGYWEGGHLVWTAGANIGEISEIIIHSNTVPTIQKDFTLAVKAPYPMQPGDTFDIFPGCDGQFSTCVSKFNNAVNFRGFTDVPGSDSLLSIF